MLYRRYMVCGGRLLCGGHYLQPPGIKFWWFQCDIKYRRVSANHTACLSGDTSSGVSNYNKKYIVQLHNYYRRNVHKYNKQPKAANMQKMVKVH